MQAKHLKRPLLVIRRTAHKPLLLNVLHWFADTDTGVT